MLGNIKVILIGGSPMSGKSTLAARFSGLHGYNHISTDDIGQILQTVMDISPMKGMDYREYYIKKTHEELIFESFEYHKKIFPAVERLISIHSKWGNPIIIEGWALYPELLKNITDDNVKKIWLLSDKTILKERLDKNKAFYFGASNEEEMKSKYLQRSLWHNEKLLSECKSTGDEHSNVRSNTSEDGLLEEFIQLIDFQEVKAKDEK